MTQSDRRRVIAGRVDTLHDERRCAKRRAQRAELHPQHRHRMVVLHDTLVWTIGIVAELDRRGLLIDVETAAKAHRDQHGPHTLKERLAGVVETPNPAESPFTDPHMEEIQGDRDRLPISLDEIRVGLGPDPYESGRSQPSGRWGRIWRRRRQW